MNNPNDHCPEFDRMKIFGTVVSLALFISKLSFVVWVIATLSR
jgi:hypothetical protein